MKLESVLLLNGPNLDMLGMREPDIYGAQSLADLEAMVAAYASQYGIAVSRFQSNSEGDLIGVIHDAPRQFDAIIYNPGAHTHYSYALRDAVASIDVPVVEVHISDVDQREAFRRVSVIAPACVAQVKGLGFDGYCKALDILRETENPERLGEGYESGVPAGAHVTIGGTEIERKNKTLAETAAESDVHAEDLRIPSEESTLDAVLGQAAAEVQEEDAAAQAAWRAQRVRALCDQMSVDALLVRDTSNIRWLTALDGVFDEERAHSLLIAPQIMGLHTDSRYSNAIRTGFARAGVSCEVDDGRVGHMQFAKQLLEADGAGFEGRMAFEDSITYAEYVKAVSSFGPSHLAATTDAVLTLRATKDPSELVRMRAAQAITDAAFLHIVDFMRPGMTEREIQLELEAYMLRHGAEGLAFGSIVATGANGADPHAIPGPTKLESGQCVVMDFGARAFGYCSDMTRMVFLGEPEGTMAKAWEVLRRANEEVEAMLRPGVTGKQAHELAERVLADGGFEGKMGHGLGHGVGIDVHELPVLNLRNDKPLAEGSVVTVEPGIYLPGQFGMRLEDCGVVTSEGYVVFSQLGHEMVII